MFAGKSFPKTSLCMCSNNLDWHCGLCFHEKSISKTVNTMIKVHSIRHSAFKKNSKAQQPSNLIKSQRIASLSSLDVRCPDQSALLIAQSHCLTPQESSSSQWRRSGREDEPIRDSTVQSHACLWR